MPSETGAPTDVFFFEHYAGRAGSLFTFEGVQYRSLRVLPFCRENDDRTIWRGFRIDAIDLDDPSRNDEPVTQVHPPALGWPPWYCVEIQAPSTHEDYEEMCEMRAREQRILDRMNERRQQEAEAAALTAGVPPPMLEGGEPGTIEPLRTEPMSVTNNFVAQMMRAAFGARPIGDWSFQWGKPTPENAPPPRPSNVAERTLNEEERLFMLRSVARIEAELAWLRNNNATVCRAWKEAKRAKLSDTSAAEMALICLARENEDLRRQLHGPAIFGA